MTREWLDKLPEQQAFEIWQTQVEKSVVRQIDTVERELRQAIRQTQSVPAGFYEAARAFLSLRDRLLPGLCPDPAWKILVTLAETPEGSPKSSITGIMNGAEIPLTTALRHIAVLEAYGIVERMPHPTDKRQMMLRLTPEGRDKLDQIAGQWQMRLLMLLLLPFGLMIAWNVAGII